MVKITANSVEQFSAISEKLKELPKSVYEQILIAEQSAVGIKCTLKQAYGQSNTIMVPADVDKICDFGDHIGIYTKHFYIEIPYESEHKDKLRIGYTFVK